VYVPILRLASRRLRTLILIFKLIDDKETRYDVSLHVM
jgi:hypothetical protein